MNPVHLGCKHLCLIDGELYLQADAKVGIYRLGPMKSFAVCWISGDRYGLNLYDIQAGCTKRIFHVGLFLTVEKINEWVSKIFVETKAVLRVPAVQREDRSFSLMCKNPKELDLYTRVSPFFSGYSLLEIEGGKERELSIVPIQELQNQGSRVQMSESAPDPLPHFLFGQGSVVEADRPLGREGDNVDFRNLGELEWEDDILLELEQFMSRFSQLRGQYLHFFPEDEARLRPIDAYFERLKTREPPTLIEMRIFYEIVKSVIGEKPFIESKCAQFADFAASASAIYPKIGQLLVLYK